MLSLFDLLLQTLVLSKMASGMGRFPCIFRERESQLHTGVSVLPSAFLLAAVAMSFVLPGHWVSCCPLLLKGALMKLGRWTTKP